MYLINTHVLHVDYIYLINAKFYIEIMHSTHFCSAARTLASLIKKSATIC